MPLFHEIIIYENYFLYILITDLRFSISFSETMRKLFPHYLFCKEGDWNQLEKKIQNGNLTVLKISAVKPWKYKGTWKKLMLNLGMEFSIFFIWVSVIHVDKWVAKWCSNILSCSDRKLLLQMLLLQKSNLLKHLHLQVRFFFLFMSNKIKSYFHNATIFFILWTIQENTACKAYEALKYCSANKLYTSVVVPNIEYVFERIK